MIYANYSESILRNDNIHIQILQNQSFYNMTFVKYYHEI